MGLNPKPFFVLIQKFDVGLLVWILLLFQGMAVHPHVFRQCLQISQELDELEQPFLVLGTHLNSCAQIEQKIVADLQRLRQQAQDYHAVVARFDRAIQKI